MQTAAQLPCKRPRLCQTKQGLPSWPAYDAVAREIGANELVDSNTFLTLSLGAGWLSFRLGSEGFQDRRLGRAELSLVGRSASCTSRDDARSMELYMISALDRIFSHSQGLAPWNFSTWVW